jgi:heat shock 70kDa protein 4
MSVVGLDVGNDASCVAVARKRGVDVLLNKESSRETPSMVSFGDKMRFLGTDAAGKIAMNPRNTVHNLKRLLGKKFSDPLVQRELPRLPFKVTEDPSGGGCLVHATYAGEPSTFTPEQLVAMVLVDLKRVAEADGGVAPGAAHDACLSVPCYYTEAERHAMLAACHVADVKCLRLINETTAIALAYGIYKTDLPAPPAGSAEAAAADAAAASGADVKVAFVDVGHSATQVSIVSLRKTGLKVLSHAWDRCLGGRDLDELLYEHFRAEFKAKTKLDVEENPKSALRLRTACEKVKKVLSANAEAPLAIECLMEDTDIRGSITREQFEAMASPVLERMAPVVRAALAQAGVKPEDVAVVELVGSGTRVPALARIVEAEFAGKQASRTLNAKECVCRGCALQAAMLSPLFRVRDFDVADAAPYPVALTWQKPGAAPGEPPVVQTLFERNSPFPSAKIVTFNRAEPFSVEAIYPEEAAAPAAGAEDDAEAAATRLPPGVSRSLGTFHVGPFKVPEGQEKAKLKVRVALDLHGLVSVERVEAHYEEVVAAAAEDKAAPAAAGAEAAPAAAEGAEAAAAAGSDGGAAAANGSEGGAAGGGADAAPMDADAAAAAAAAAAATAADAPPAATPTTTTVTKKVKRVDVPVRAQGTHAFPQRSLDTLLEREGEMQAQDRLQEDTANAKNALEAYVYALRNRLYGDLQDYVKDADRESLSARLSATEDWLYDEGEDEKKSVYVAKLAELQASGGPIEARLEAEKGRGPAAASLRETATRFASVAASQDAKYAHLTAEDRQLLDKEATEALSWLSEKEGMQASLKKSDEPALTAADCDKKRGVLERVCGPVASKPAPPPPKPEKVAEEAKAAAEGGPQVEEPAEEAMEADGGEEAAAAAAAVMADADEMKE